MSSDAGNDELIGLIRDSAASYVASESTLMQARRANQGGSLTDSVWSGLSELGWCGMLAPEAAGGGGLHLAEALALHEELGRGLAPAPLALASHLPILTLNRCAGQAAESMMTDIVVGNPCAVAWQGVPGQLSCEASDLKLDGGTRARVSGMARFVIGAELAQRLLVAARGPQGVGLYRIDMQAAGIQRADERLADGTIVSTLVFAGVEVGEVIDHSGGRALDAALDETRLILSAEMLGLMREVLARTLDYMRTRKQFGRAIGSFQALQHRAVDLHAQVELTAAAVARSVEQMEGVTEERVRAVAASAVKARASEAALVVCREAVQLHGAIAYTQEHDIGLFLNRALVLSALLGNGAAHRRRYGLIVSQTLAA